MSETTLGPSGPGGVVLDLGPGVGALVLHAPPELNGREIDISVRQDPHARRTHSRVRPRHTPAGIRYAAIYPALPAGDYTIWRDAGTPATSATITGGGVTTASWPDQPA